MSIASPVETAVTPPKHKLTLEELFAPLPPYVHVPETVPVLDRRWVIYLLTSKADGLSYVGLTCRPLAARLCAHSAQARRQRPVRPGGLMARLRTVFAGGATLQDAFDIKVVASADTAAEARLLEQRWMALVGCRRPNGLNDLPGGGLGGTANAVSVEIRLPGGRLLWYTSINAAIADRNRTLRQTKKPIIQPSTVYARLAAGWPPIEALEYQAHQNGRGDRGEFQYAGRAFRSLRKVTASTGICAATLRSKLYRRGQAQLDADPIHDLRRTVAGHQRPRLLPLMLRLPGERRPLTAAAYAARTGTPKATVMHRWHAAARYGLDVHTLSPRDLLAWLTTPGERRKLITLRLPDGRVWQGGEREVIRRLFADPEQEASRVTRLSVSGIRRRLRTLPEEDRESADYMAWAFGFGTVCGER